ncbi:hypothetical protein K2173_024952 [Erythroxylum novogranatense]|uniref:DYW domain-containing protein n=1 Tax=Erythroxylum novogranatense TaxID=1862640 RepID=A0AAV8UG73_9ROSI|nr:hypothetical protein K2173_024952 [Erythroxylum novogranatense]
MRKVRILIRSRCFIRQIKTTQYLHSVAVAKSSAFCDWKVEFNRRLNGLSKLGRIQEARQMFDECPDKDEFAWNTMIAAYANAGRLTEADRLFREAKVKSSITWSGLISGYCRYGYENEAFELFCEMQLKGERPTQYTLGSVLRLCSETGSLQRGEQIHGFVTKTGFSENAFVVTALIDAYAKCKCVSEAEYLFEAVADRKNCAIWTAMLTGYAQNGESFSAIKCFQDMRAEGIESNQFTFPSILTACGAVAAPDFGVQVHGCIVKNGFDANIFVQSTLIDMYAKCRDLDSAKRVLECMEVDDEISWNSMIVGCARNGFGRETVSWFRKMHARNMKLDNFTYPSVLNSLAFMEDKENAVCVHCLIIKTGFGGFKLVSNALVDMYAKQGKLDCAFTVFNLMVERDVISWTSLVTGYAHNGAYEEAIKLFREMRVEGIHPDQIVIASVLSASAELTIIEFGLQVHAILIRSGLGSSLSVNNSLITMYAKCGGITDANQVFESMRTRDVISWTAMVVGYAQNGRGKDSVCFYDQMIAAGIRPDSVAFVGLLFACSHAGLVEKGRHYFDTMNKVYGIQPGPEHYACMIDLLARSGKLVEAQQLMSQMVVEPDATVWKALLAACRLHGELDLGEKAAKNLFELEPRNSVPYVMLSNMYSKACRWEDAARIRRLMRSRGIRKEPGCSWMEINGNVHTFFAEDRSHPLTADIYLKIEEIMMLIRKAGYVPDMNSALHDINDESKELGLSYHSEKLAVAFGILSLPRGAPIRIFKNLRVCGDCHTAMKCISNVYSRYIILRDSNCFHHFREGKCSCADYW